MFISPEYFIADHTLLVRLAIAYGHGITSFPDYGLRNIQQTNVTIGNMTMF